MSKYHSDQPIQEVNSDEFNRGVFVNDFIEILANFEGTENYIVGLFAKWGLGKTSVVNLILEKLNSENSFCTVYVSAWAFGGDYEKILRDILEQIYQKIENKSTKTKRGRFGKCLSKIAKAELPFELDTELDLNGGGRAETKISSGKIANTARYIGEILSSTDNITKARKRVEKSIEKSRKKVIVFIDDLDRLEGRRIMEILRIINTIADYGGMTYVLPFDKRYVCSAIKECLPDGQSGDEFIEKIIQVPINLPALTQEKINKVMFNKLNLLLSEYHIFVSSEEISRFQKLYFGGVDRYLTSPRDINKLINVLKFKLPSANGEINIIDTIILEIVRVFDELLYEIIKKNRELMIKQVNTFSQQYLMDSDNKSRKDDADKMLSSLNELQKQTIRGLFPAIDTLYTSMSWLNSEELRRNQRLAAENYFDLYFASLDEEDGISDKKIIQLLQLSDKPKKLREALVRLVNQNNFDIAIKTMIDRIELVENKLEFCKALLDLVEVFPSKHTISNFMLSPIDTIIFRIDDILKDSDTKLDDYISLLDYNYEASRVDTIPLLIREVVIYSQKGNNRKEIDLTKDEVEFYKKHALEVIRGLAEQDKIPLNTSDDYAFIYSYWVEFGNKTESFEYVKRHIKMGDQAVDFISQFLGKGTELGKNDYHRTDFNESTYKRIDECVNPEYIYNILIHDEKYKALCNSKKEELISIEDSTDEKNGWKSEFSKVGNEHTDEFRLVVARRFMYFYENAVQDR